MRIAVIIPFYNAEENINSALSSLSQQEVFPDEIILVDNGSTDNSLKIIQEFKEVNKGLTIVLASESKKGPAAARNKGLGLAHADAVAFMDSDCIAEKDWVKNLKELYQDPSVCAIGGVTRIYEPRTSIEKVQAMDEFYSAKIDYTRKSHLLLGNLLVTNNSSYRKEIINKLGGFDDSFLVGEDVDLYMRLLERLTSEEKVLVHCDKVKMWHRPRKTFAELIRQKFSYRVALARLVKRHFKGKAILNIPSLGLFEYSNLPFTICIDSAIIQISVFLLLCLLLKKIIIYLFLILFLAVFMDIHINSKKVHLKITLWEFMVIGFFSLIKKLVSEFAKIYGSIKYRVICL